MPSIILEIVEKHAEEAAFLWLLRQASVHEAHYALENLAKLDNRAQGHRQQQLLA